MCTRSCLVFYLLNLAIIWRVKCNNLYVHPKTVYITGNKIAISCINAFDDHAATIAKDIEWIKLSHSLSVISSHPQARIRRDGHRLLFDSTNYSDKGLYCCRYPGESHGCTENSTVTVAVARNTRSSGWSLQANPRHRCVLLGRSASVNCLNSTTFAQNIQWFKILDNGELQLITHSLEGRIVSNAHQLQFKYTVAGDEGLYCCKAFSETKCSPTAVTNITISLPPEISPLQNQTVQLGETIAINCTTTNGEDSTFLWQRHGKDIPKNDPKYSIILSENNATLIITNATTMDQGYYTCKVKNKKYQQDTASLYLHVQLPLSCRMINISYSITIGLQTPNKTCSSIEEATLYSVTNNFLQSICNCSDYCMTLEINCTPDDTIATIVVILREKEPLFLKTQVYSALKGQVQVNFNNQNYSIFCVVKTLCEESPTPTVGSNDTLSNGEETTDTTTISANTSVVITIIILLLILLLLIASVIAIIIALQLCKYKQKSKALTKKAHDPQLQISSILHSTNSLQPTSRTEAGNQHPSTSSEDHLLPPDTGSPISDSGDDPFSSNMNHSTDNPNTNLPNGNERTNSSILAVKSSNNPSSAKRSKNKDMKKNQINSTPKHDKNIQLANVPHKIQWAENETYVDHDFQKSTNVYNSLAKPEEVNTHFYEDAEGVNESKRRATIAASHMHHNKKYPQPRPVSHSTTQYPRPVHSNHSVSPVHANGTRAKSLSIPNAKYPSSSVV